MLVQERDSVVSEVMLSGLQKINFTRKGGDNKALR